VNHPNTAMTIFGICDKNLDWVQKSLQTLVNKPFATINISPYFMSICCLQSKTMALYCLGMLNQHFWILFEYKLQKLHIFHIIALQYNNIKARCVYLLCIIIPFFFTFYTNRVIESIDFVIAPIKIHRFETSFTDRYKFGRFWVKFASLGRSSSSVFWQNINASS
jgi:hypothetical protein